MDEEAYDYRLTIRRKLLGLEVGDSVVFPISMARQESIESVSERFAKARSLSIRIEKIDSGVRITRVEFTKRPVGRPPRDPREHKYPFTALEIGQSVLIDAPQTEHAKIRCSVSARSQKTGARYTCNKEGDALRVTRVA